MAYNTHSAGIQYSGNDYEDKAKYFMLENTLRDEDYQNNSQNSYNKDKSEKPFGQDYHRIDEEAERKEEKLIDEEETKMEDYKNKETHKDEIPKKQTESEFPQEVIKEGLKDSKNSRTIEDAIKIAIKQEQNLLMGD